MNDQTDKIEINPVQLAIARALLLVEDELEPRCENCGVGVNRPKCAYDYDPVSCGRHEQADTLAYERALNQLIRDLDAAGPKLPYGWRYQIELHLLFDFSKKERDLLLDLRDMGGKQSTRQADDRFNSLRKKGAVDISAMDKYYVEITKRGEELIEYWENGQERK